MKEERELIKHLSDKRIIGCTISGINKKCLKLHFKGEKEDVIFKGEKVKDLMVLLFKNKHKRADHPSKLRRCPKCNLRGSIHNYDNSVKCHTCDYETDLETWNNENPHLRF